MLEKYTTEREIGPSVCDADGQLSYAESFGLFMDIASVHAGQLGNGVLDMAGMGLFWLTVKTQINFINRPQITQMVTMETWPEQHSRMRGNRSYVLRCGDEMMLTGKTEWAVITTDTHRLTPIEGVYPDGYRFDLPGICPEPFARIPDRFEGLEPYAEYRVRSTDIDVGGHMNNTAYVRALMGTFTGEEMKKMQIKRMDVMFKTPCYEGDLLHFTRKKDEFGLEIRASREEDTVLLVRIQ